MGARLLGSSEIRETTMLDLASIDLDDLVLALEDHSYETSWWLDPATGEFEYCSTEDDPEDFESRGQAYVEPMDSSDGYRDMVDFTALVRDGRAADLLFRALQGRGAFRRFKDTLFEFPDLRQEWFAFHDRRMRRRAIEWLADRELISAEAAQQAAEDLAEGEEGPVGPLGAFGIAEKAAAQLRQLYGNRLARVLLYGSQARGDADRESDLDLLVVLRDMESAWEELRRMDDLLWRLSVEQGVTLSALPVTEKDFDRARSPVLIEARSHGVAVG